MSCDVLGICTTSHSGRDVVSVEDVGLWLDVDKLDGEGEVSDPPDLFAVGFQEVKDAYI